MLVMLSNQHGLSNTLKQRNLFCNFFSFSIIILGLLLLLTFQKSSHNRYFLPWVGNPNYTCMLYFGMFISIDIINNHVSKKFKNVLYTSSILLFSFVIFLTETRSSALAFIVFVFSKYLLSKNSDTYARNMAIFIAHFSVIGQFLALLLFQFLGVHFQGSRSSFNIFDDSNLERVNAFYTALKITLSGWGYAFSGIGDVDTIWETMGDQIENVPHNWFMMMTFSNGYAITITIFLIILYSLKKVDIKYIPGLTGIMVIAFIVGRAALFTPLVLFLIACFIGNLRSNPRIAQ